MEWLRRASLKKYSGNQKVRLWGDSSGNHQQGFEKVTTCESYFGAEQNFDQSPSQAKGRKDHGEIPDPPARGLEKIGNQRKVPLFCLVATAVCEDVHDQSAKILLSERHFGIVIV